MSIDRRKFILGAGLGIAAAASPISLFGKNDAPAQIKRSGRLKLKFFPYELKLKHAFNLAKYSRTTTPDVQVELEYDGVVGYGECSMPPYLGESVESVCKFLGSLNLEQFTDPFRKEDILAYVESVAPNNRAAKAGVDIALHDLLGKLMGQPWYKIWGLNPEKAPLTTCTIGIDTDEVVRQKMTETYDFKLIKVKMGLGGIEKDKHLYELCAAFAPTSNSMWMPTRVGKPRKRLLKWLNGLPTRIACLWSNHWKRKSHSTTPHGSPSDLHCLSWQMRHSNACPTFAASTVCIQVSTSS